MDDNPYKSPQRIELGEQPIRTSNKPQRIPLLLGSVSGGLIGLAVVFLESPQYGGVPVHFSIGGFVLFILVGCIGGIAAALVSSHLGTRIK
jgi:hypothetical protein